MLVSESCFLVMSSAGLGKQQNERFMKGTRAGHHQPNVPVNHRDERTPSSMQSIRRDVQKEGHIMLRPDPHGQTNDPVAMRTIIMVVLLQHPNHTR